MGFYPYIQKCVNGHEWGAYFCSVSPMYDSGVDKCPECGGDIAKEKKEDGDQPVNK